jgi:hypothetical protein
VFGSAFGTWPMSTEACGPLTMVGRIGHRLGTWPTSLAQPAWLAMRVRTARAMGAVTTAGTAVELTTARWPTRCCGRGGAGTSEGRGAHRARGGGCVAYPTAARRDARVEAAHRRESGGERGPPVLGAGGWHRGDEGGGGDAPGSSREGMTGTGGEGGGSAQWRLNWGKGMGKNRGQARRALIEEEREGEAMARA